jgi:glutathione S-transferase
MTPILVYGHPLGSSMGLVAAFEWLGQPYRLTRVDMLGEMREASYRRLNPRVETPVLVLPEGVITETSAIASWLAHNDPERRISFAPGTFDYFRMIQYLGFLNTGFTAAFTPMWIALEAEHLNADEREQLRRHGRERVNERHQRLEEMIGDTPFLLGERPTLADAVFIGVARWAQFHQAIDPADFPRVTALRERLENDAAVRFATALEDGEQPRGSGALVGQVPLAELLASLREPEVLAAAT